MDGDNIPDLTELYGEFVSENKELLEKFSRDLVTLETSPDDSTIINGLFRSAHTIKGNAGFIGLTSLGQIAHKIENVLDHLREGEFSFFPEINDVFFKALDSASVLLQDFVDGKEESGDLADIMSALDSLSAGPQQKLPKEEKKKNLTQDVALDHPESLDSSFMRVSTVRLDRMVNLVGELATGRSRLLQISNEMKNEELTKVASYLNNISSQLQNEVLGIRMVPVKDLFNRFYRLVRDTSRSLGKDIKLVVKGEETELDKSVIEMLYDPLVHIVRNCVGHGIEAERDRMKSGKDKAGTITLNAYHEHNSIYIQVIDDGKGLDIEGIRGKAIEKGLITADEARTASDDEIARHIFSPGFSTAGNVDSVSGRGVGMEVVKANIEKVGGDVGLGWDKGKGTTITIRVPLTLAIVQLFLVRSGRHIFGIPMPYVDETIRIDRDSMEYIKGQMICMIRHKAIPIVHLSDVFSLDKNSSGENTDSRYNTVIINQMGMKAGIVIDEFMGKVETVIKPLGKFIERLSEPVEGISGASILGTGDVVLVLDVPTLWNVLV